MDAAKRETIRRRYRGDVEKLLNVRCGPVLPDDDAGREYLLELLKIVSLGPRAAEKIANVIDLRAPWMDDREAAELVNFVTGLPKEERWPTGKALGEALRLTNAERKTLLVAGAAGGMSATFPSPIAAVLLAVELLLFEWKPRSLVPVTLASAAAMATRVYLMGTGPLFPVPPHNAWIGAASTQTRAPAAGQPALSTTVPRTARPGRPSVTSSPDSVVTRFTRPPVSW